MAGTGTTKIGLLTNIVLQCFHLSESDSNDGLSAACFDPFLTTSSNAGLISKSPRPADPVPNRRRQQQSRGSRQPTLKYCFHQPELNHQWAGQKFEKKKMLL